MKRTRTKKRCRILSVLIVDDEKTVVETLQTALTPTGYRCAIETDPVKALKLYKKHHFDVVISDVRMPGMSGIELLKNIRKIDPLCRVIIITAFGDLETAIQAINNHAYAFYGKPVDFRSLVKTLNDIEKEVIEGVKVSIDQKKLQIELQHLNRAYLKLLNRMQNLSSENSILKKNLSKVIE